MSIVLRIRHSSIWTVKCNQQERTPCRYPYSINRFSHVLLETAGTVDLDVEIKFLRWHAAILDDVNKKHIKELKDLYKALVKIEEIAYENEIITSYATKSLDMTSGTLTGLPIFKAASLTSSRRLQPSRFHVARRNP